MKRSTENAPPSPPACAPTLNGSTRTVTSTLRHPVYWSARYRVTNYKDEQVTHTGTEPIVLKAVFDAANRELDSRSPLGSHPRHNIEDFSGALYDEAGHLLYRALNGSARSQGSRTRTYRCAKCKLNFDADRTDELVDARLRDDPFAEIKLVHVPASNYAADREALQDELDNPATAEAATDGRGRRARAATV